MFSIERKIKQVIGSFFIRRPNLEPIDLMESEPKHVQHFIRTKGSHGFYVSARNIDLSVNPEGPVNDQQLDPEKLLEEINTISNRYRGRVRLR